MADPHELTMEELRERIRVAGITVAEHRLAMGGGATRARSSAFPSRTRTSI